MKIKDIPHVFINTFSKLFPTEEKYNLLSQKLISIMRLNQDDGKLNGLF